MTIERKNWSDDRGLNKDGESIKLDGFLGRLGKIGTGLNISGIDAESKSKLIMVNERRELRTSDEEALGVLRAIEKQLKIMNIHLHMVTNEHITKDDIDG